MDREEKLQKIKEKRIKRALRSYRLRALKNFFIWLSGVLSSVLVVILAVFIGLKVVPISSYTGGTASGVVSEEIAKMSFLDAIAKFNEYEIGDFKVIGDSLQQAIEEANIDQYVKIDFDKLNKVKFVYDDGRNIVDELQSCITVTATLNSVVGEGALGQVGQISAFAWVKVDENSAPNTDASGNIKKDSSSGELLSNPKLYYYQAPANSGLLSTESQFEYKRAFSDDGTRIAPVEKDLYLPDLGEIPVLDIVHVIFDRLNTVTVLELLNLVGDVGQGNLIENIFDGVTLGNIGTELSLENIKLSDLMTDVKNSSFIYKVLTELTEKDWEEITISNVTDLTFDDIKLVTFLDYQSNKTIFDVIVDCVNTGKGPSATPVTYEDVTISDLSYISNLDGIKLSTVLPYEGENIEIYDILLGVVNDNKAPGEELDTPNDLTVASIAQLKIQDVKLNSIIPRTETTYEADGVTVKEQGNEVLYAILNDVINGDKAPTHPDYVTYDDISIKTFKRFDISNLKFNTVLPKDNGNEVLYDILNDIVNKGKTAGDVGYVPYDKISITSINNFNIDDLKISTIIPLEKTTYEPDGVTVKEQGNEALFTILLDIVNKEVHPGQEGYIDLDELKIGHLHSVQLDYLQLDHVVPVEGNEILFTILSDAIGKDNSDDEKIMLRDFHDFEIKNIKIASLIGEEDTGNNILDLIKADNTATLGNIAEKINGLKISEVFGENGEISCFTTKANGRVYYKATNSSGKVCYVNTAFEAHLRTLFSLNIDTSTEYYIAKDCTVWLSVLYERAGADVVLDDNVDYFDLEGYGLLYFDRGLTYGQFKSGIDSMSENFKDSTIRELKVCGMLSADYHKDLYPLTIDQALSLISLG